MCIYYNDSHKVKQIIWAYKDDIDQVLVLVIFGSYICVRVEWTENKKNDDTLLFNETREKNKNTPLITNTQHERS